MEQMDWGSVHRDLAWVLLDPSDQASGPESALASVRELVRVLEWEDHESRWVPMEFPSDPASGPESARAWERVLVRGWEWEDHECWWARTVTPYWKTAPRN